MLNLVDVVVLRRDVARLANRLGIGIIAPLPVVTRVHANCPLVKPPEDFSRLADESDFVSWQTRDDLGQQVAEGATSEPEQELVHVVDVNIEVADFAAEAGNRVEWSQHPRKPHEFKRHRLSASSCLALCGIEAMVVFP